MAKLLINEQNKALVGSTGKAYAAGNIDVLKGSTSPVDFTAAAGKLLRLMRYGKCKQASTPTPDAPVDIVCNNGAIRWDSVNQRVYVDGTPEVLTVSGANLLDPSAVIEDNKYINSSNGSPTTPSATGGVFRYSGFIPVTAGTKYYFGMTPYTASVAGLAWYSSASVSGYISGVSGSTLRNVNSMKATAPEGATYLRFGWRIDEGYDTDWEHSVYVCECINNVPVLSEWQPHPLTASVADLFAAGDYKDEQDIISGAITRKVGVYVITGAEAWSKYNDVFLCNDAIASSVLNTACVCTHYVGVKGSTAIASMRDGQTKTGTSSNTSRLFIRDDNYSTAADFKEFLAAQYAAGTPIIVIYPLATPTTESVAPQPLNTATGTNTLTDTANVSSPEYNVTYKI